MKRDRIDNILTKSVLFNLYIKDKRTPVSIAKRFFISHQSVRRRLKKHKIKVRNSSDVRKGKKPSNYKGWKNLEGYVLIVCPTHPHRSKQNYVFQHRLVVEKKLGRYLTKQEIVHHLNGIRNDNRPENLVVTNRQSHNTKSLIHSLQERIRRLELK